MIITQTPLRMSFAGGGSDLPAFYRQFGGAVVSTAIDKYVYINVNKKFDNWIRLSGPPDGLLTWSPLIVPQQPVVVLAGTRPAGMYRSPDGGRWGQSSSPNLTVLEMVPMYGA